MSFGSVMIVPFFPFRNCLGEQMFLPDIFLTLSHTCFIGVSVDSFDTWLHSGDYTETEMSSFWWNFHHWLHWKLSKWQLLVQPVMKISSPLEISYEICCEKFAIVYDGFIFDWICLSAVTCIWNYCLSIIYCYKWKIIYKCWVVAFFVIYHLTLQFRFQDSLFRWAQIPAIYLWKFPNPTLVPFTEQNQIN